MKVHTRMKAVIHPKYGSPDVLKLMEVEKPAPGDHEVLIKVMASTVNRTDCAMLRAKPFIMRFFTGFFKPKKIVPGTDFSGVIEALGKEVSTYKIGDRVFGFDDMGLSTKAQYMVLSEDQPFISIPQNTSFEMAAASIEGAHYAYNFINKVNIKKGQKVLVNGATGAIGSAAVQLLRYYEADITAVCDTKNLALVKSIGAKKTIDYTKEDFTRLHEKYDFVFDAVGKSSFRRCIRILNPKGVYISSELGHLVQNPFLALITPLMRGKKVVFPIPTDIKKSLQLIQKLMEEGKFKPVIDRMYFLEDIAKAYMYVEKGFKTGNVVIQCNHDN